MAGLRVRKVLRDLHLWIGLSLVLVLAPLGLTGSWLVFDEPIDRLLHPHRYVEAAPAAAPPPASAYLAAARAAFGERAAPSQLRLPQKPGAPVTVVSDRGLTAWIDPGSAKVLDVGDPRREPRGFVHQLHGNLFMGPFGRRLVGWLGLAMLASCLSGLVIWWPRNNAVLKGLRWRRGPTTWSNLHHLAGFWICVPLALLSLTGAAIAFPEAVRLVSGAPAGKGPGPRTPPSAALAHPRLSIDDAVAAALSKAGDGKLQQVQLPTPSPHPAWTVQLRGPRGSTAVRVDDATGAARAKPQPDAPGGRASADPVMRLIRQLHDGDDTGPVWQGVIFAAGLAPTLLGVTGVVVWLQRRRRRTATATAAAAAAAAAA